MRKLRKIATLLLCLVTVMASALTVSAEELNTENPCDFVVDENEKGGRTFIDSEGIKYSYYNGELITRSTRSRETVTEKGELVTHDSYYVYDSEYAYCAAEAWTTATLNGNNVYHKTGAKIGYNWVYTETDEVFGYSKTTATTDSIKNYAHRTMTSYWSTDV